MKYHLPIGMKPHKSVLLDNRRMILQISEWKNTIREGGSTALYVLYTVESVDAVDTVDTVDMVCTVDTVDIDDTVNTVYTIGTALHC